MQLIEYLEGIAPKKLGEGRLANLSQIITLSQRFHADAGIAFNRPQIDSKTFVIESGHQPNYMPHPGTWKKAFFGAKLSEILPGSVFLFGLADQNLSTAKVLSQNHLPAATKTGSIPIGFKIPEKDRWKTFDSIPKPSAEDFEKELVKIKGHYGGDIANLEDAMRESYARAKNLADYNSFLFAKVSSELSGDNIYFFRYSDVQGAGLFAKEWKKIVSILPKYNTAYNRIVAQEKIDDMHPVEEDAAPFWLHCRCGTKAAMLLSGGVLSGNCPSCKTVRLFPADELAKHLPEMSPAAVSRNIIYAEGLGTSIYLSGAGGGLRYGAISDALSKELGFDLPKTFAWAGKEYCLGRVHRAFLRDLARNIGTDAFADRSALSCAIELRRADLEDAIRSSTDKNILQKYEGRKKTIDLMLATAKEMFSLTPSFLDELVSVGNDAIRDAWSDALSSADVINKGGAGVIMSDQTYSEDSDRVFRILSSGL
jgi:hypothetical protein